MPKISLVEYIWLDGCAPTRQIRSKARVVGLPENPSVSDFPQWSFDGSSTNQAEGHDSDCLLEPVYFVSDPVRGEGNYLVVAEVLNSDGTPHVSNSRAQLRAVLDAGAGKDQPWLGFEQEYTMFDKVAPLGWPEQGFPAPQGPYYCGVGSKQIFGRELAEEHATLCMEAGLMFYGINAEVMPGQWEFQIGYRGVEGEDGDALVVCDHMLLARWLMHRASEAYGIHVSLENKPIKGDWNGAGMHTNFSTEPMRKAGTGKKAIDDAIKRLEDKHAEHIAIYGDKLSERLTGQHETSSINDFSAGSADRGCSIRIPQMVELKGYGYLEDRRPGANADPYLVAARLCATVSAVDEEVVYFRSWPYAKAA